MFDDSDDLNDDEFGEEQDGFESEENDDGKLHVFSGEEDEDEKDAHFGSDSEDGQNFSDLDQDDSYENDMNDENAADDMQTNLVNGETIQTGAEGTSDINIISQRIQETIRILNNFKDLRDPEK